MFSCEFAYNIADGPWCRPQRVLGPSGPVLAACPVRGLRGVQPAPSGPGWGGAVGGGLGGALVGALVEALVGPLVGALVGAAAESAGSEQTE